MSFINPMVPVNIFRRPQMEMEVGGHHASETPDFPSEEGPTII